MVKKRYVPERGDVVWIDLDPTRGHEQANTRPVVVLSPSIYNQRTGLMLACAITSRVKGYPFEVALVGMHIKGVALSDQLRNLDWQACGAQFIEKVPPAMFDDIIEQIETLLLAR